jgi:hypothetical protein
MRCQLSLLRISGSEVGHGLRHAAASLLMAGDVHPTIVREALGHTQFRFTMDRYTHVAAKVQRRAVETIQHPLGDANSPLIVKVTVSQLLIDGLDGRFAV